MKLGQRRNLDLLQIRGLRGCPRQEDRHSGGEEQNRNNLAVHCAPPWFAGPESPGPCSPPLSAPAPTDSISPTVRFVSTKVSLATRRMSAFVTLSMRSTVRNSSRQSP